MHSWYSLTRYTRLIISYLQGIQEPTEPRVCLLLVCLLHLSHRCRQHLQSLSSFMISLSPLSLAPPQLYYHHHHHHHHHHHQQHSTYTKPPECVPPSPSFFHFVSLVPSICISFSYPPSLFLLSQPSSLLHFTQSPSPCQAGRNGREEGKGRGRERKTLRRT